MPYKKTMLSFEQALALFHEGSLTPRDYLEQVIDSTDLAEDPFRAFARLDLARAREQADAASDRYARQAPLSALDGMLIGVKDIVSTGSLPTEMGSDIYRDYFPRQNAPAVDALVEGGAVILGKTHTTEFAIGRPTVTLNPHDVRHTPGGSSSGTAAAVAAGMLEAGLGTQTQGSIIRPASYCGVVGYKPSWGVLPTQGVHPVSYTHDHLGVIARSVDTAWAVAYQIMDWLPGGAQASLPGCLPTLSAADARLSSVAVLQTAGYAELSADEQESFQNCCKDLSAGGIEVIWPDADPSLASLCSQLDAVPDISAEIVARDMVWPYGHYAQQHPASLSEKIHDMVRRGRAVTHDRYLALLSQRSPLLSQLRELSNRYDAFILPASSGVAPLGLENTGSRTLGVYATYLGTPAVSLPAMLVGHMPMGLQLMGLPKQDHALMCQARRVTELLGLNS